MARRLIWSVGMALAYLLVNGKTVYDTAGALFLTSGVGAIIGLLLSYASERPTSLASAQLKLVFWPAALILFWTFLTTYPRFYVTDALWSAAISGGAGLVIGSAHLLVAWRRLRREAGACTFRLPFA